MIAMPMEPKMATIILRGGVAIGDDMIAHPPPS